MIRLKPEMVGRVLPDTFQFILENVVPFIKSAYKLEQQDIISQADYVQKA